MKLASFDIFDTCLIRASGHPASVFDIIGKELSGSVDSHKWKDFANERIKAEKKARLQKDNDVEEVTLDDIYKNAEFSNLTDKSTDSLKELECECESSVLLGVKSIKDKISRLRAQGFEIAFISDMYLPSEFLRKLLIREGFFEDGDRLFVSSEYMKTKAIGSLFQAVKENYSNKISTWIHYGDNHLSDYLIPKKYGASPRLIKHKFTVAERIICQSPYYFDNGRGALLASISKAVRIKYLTPEITFAADYIAPLFVPFVYDILSTAKKEGITKLFFIARDGKILYEIAKEFSELFPSISINYIYLSRSSLYFPSLENIDQLPEIINHKMTSAVGLDKILKNYCGVDINGEQLNSFTSIEEVLKDNKLRQVLTNRHKNQRELLLNYLCQVKLATSSGKNAIVDLRGTGKTHRMINRLLKSIGYFPVMAFYLELGKSRKPLQPEESYHSIINNERYFGVDSVMLENPPILESVYAAADHGRTIGYELSCKQVKPIIEANEQLHLNQRLFSNNKTAVALWAQYYIVTKAYLDNKFHLYTGLSLLKSLLFSPDYEALKILSNVKVSETGIEKQVLVRKLTLEEIFRRRIKKADSLTWFTGSFSYSFGKLGGYALKLLRKLHSIKNIR